MAHGSPRSLPSLLAAAVTLLFLLAPEGFAQEQPRTAGSEHLSYPRRTRTCRVEAVAAARVPRASCRSI